LNQNPTAFSVYQHVPPYLLYIYTVWFLFSICEQRAIYTDTYTILNNIGNSWLCMLFINYIFNEICLFWMQINGCSWRMSENEICNVKNITSYDIITQLIILL